MLFLSVTPVLLALLGHGALGLKAEEGCGETGCLEVQMSEVASLETTKGMDKALSRLPQMDVALMKKQMWNTLFRPVAELAMSFDSHLPPMCRSSNFKNYRNFVDDRKFERRSEASGSKADCCRSCHETADCFSFTYDTAKSQCNIYVTKEKLKSRRAENEMCPLGVGNGRLEMPHYPLWPGHYGHEAGPCLSVKASKTFNTGHGLELQVVKDGFDRGILNLPKDREVDPAEL